MGISATMHSSPRRSRGRSFGSRRNNRQIQNYVLFVSLLSVFILFYQQRSFMPAQVSEEKNPNVLFAAESAVKEKEADIKPIKKGEGVAKPNPKKDPKKDTNAAMVWADQEFNDPFLVPDGLDVEA